MIGRLIGWIVFLAGLAVRYIHPFLWDPIIVTVMLWWAFAVLMVLGLLILALSGRRARARTTLSRRPS